jgi:hypothetical protein
MCGIVASLSRNGPIAPETLTSATKALHHRGSVADPRGEVGVFVLVWEKVR